MASVDIEAHARALEAHPDYRVLRRLATRAAYAAPDGRPLAKGVVVDTETTGLDHARDKIVELGLVSFEFDPASGQVFRVLEVLDALEDPGMPIPAESTAVHGITDEMVAGQRIDDDRVAALVDGAVMVIAHNAAFDRPFLEARLPVFSSMAWACSLEQIDWNAEGFGGRALDYIAYRLGFFYDAHRAENDCLALLEALQHPLPKSARTGMKYLLEQYAKTTYRIWARGSPFETKDALKAHAYRWDAEQKCWHKTVNHDDLKEETDWLKTNVYGGRRVKIEVEEFDRFSLFSTRGGLTISRAI